VALLRVVEDANLARTRAHEYLIQLRVPQSPNNTLKLQ
jgi:hypothetical protein